VALFLGFGQISDGMSKPDLVAPKVNIISTRKCDKHNKRQQRHTISNQLNTSYKQGIGPYVSWNSTFWGD
jgi:hypothetical protein